MKEFIKDYGTLILACYGVVQVWLIALWKKFFRQGKLQIFKTGKIEVGFSNFGPTLALNGTLVSKHNDIFVSSISIIVTKIKDNSVHTLDWNAFRSASIPIRKIENISIEIPSGFIVRRDSPHRYNIFFGDTLVQKELSPCLIQVDKEWGKFLHSKSEHIQKISQTGVPHESIIQVLYENEYSKNSQLHHKAWDILRSKVFWEPGRYNAIMKISTDNPNQNFEDKWSFEIDEDAYESLKLNTVTTLREICLGLGNARYFYNYPEYQKNV